jgi:hypothetical protein
MRPRTRRIIGWAGVAALYSALILAVIVCAGLVFHRISIERFSVGYSRVWLRHRKPIKSGNNSDRAQ